MESLKKTRRTIFKQAEAIENALTDALSRNNKLHIKTQQKSGDGIEQRFYEEYFVPGFAKLYRGTYHEEVFFNSATGIDAYVKDQYKRVTVLCLWIEKNGFFHCFENEIFLVGLSSMYSGIDPSVKRYLIGDAASYFPALVEAYAELDKKANRIICFLALFAFIGVGAIPERFI